MTTTRSTLNETGFDLHVRRMRLTNQERAEMLLNETEALAIARDCRVPVDHRILSLHRLLEIAFTKAIADGECLLVEIGACMQETFEKGILPTRLLRMVANSTQSMELREWTREQCCSKPGQAAKSAQVAA